MNADKHCYLYWLPKLDISMSKLCVNHVMEMIWKQLLVMIRECLKKTFLSVFIIYHFRSVFDTQGAVIPCKIDHFYLWMLLVLKCIFIIPCICLYPYNKVHGAHMGPTWVLSAPDGPHVGSMNLATKVSIRWTLSTSLYYLITDTW